MTDCKIIGMWSGPRNLSTAMMRSFSQRPDTQVWDEPFYAAYLSKTGIDHPMRNEIIADGIKDYQAVAKACREPAKSGKQVFYQKHMTQHMIDGVDLAWTDRVTNAFLIRSPERVLASYAKKRGEVCAADLGYDKQRELFDRQAAKTGMAPVVIDSFDIRRSPEASIRMLCKSLEIEFYSEMLRWKAGPSQDDGIWASHWYDAIWNSTGFAPPENTAAAVPGHLMPIRDAVMADYEAVAKHKLRIS